MGRFRGSIEIGQYPVDQRGFAVHPRELGLYEEDEKSNRINNHHMSFYASKFGSTAISLAFRNLDSQQVLMDYDKHVRLHQVYTGIELPPFINMMDRLNLEYQTQDHRADKGPYKIWNLNQRTYERRPISKLAWQTLKNEYNQVAVSQVYVDLGSSRKKS